MELNQGKVTNRYLSRMEKWEETEVDNYKKKVNLQLASPWVKAFLLLGIYGACTGVLWLANLLLSTFEVAGGVFDIVSSWITTLALFVIFYGVAILLGILDSVGGTQKFVVDNRGEVGHAGRPYSKGVGFNFIVSIAIAAVSLIGVLVVSFLFVIEGDFSKFEFAITMPALLSMDILGSLLFIPGALIYPLVYNLRAKSVLNAFDADTCPVCGRSNFRLVKRAVDKSTDEILSKQVAYIPGKIAYVYGQYIIDRNKNGRETDMNSFITYCRYCSFYVKGNGTEKLN